MDGINNNFGNLSLGAAEWKPPASSSTRGVNRISSSTSHTNSDLNAGQVKEFIPGQGWIVQSSSAQESATTTNEAQIATNTSSDNIYETSIPAGPSPSPSPMAFRSLHSMSVSDELYRHYRNLSLEGIRQMDPSDPQHKAVPLPYCNA